MCGLRIPRRQKIRPGGDTGHWETRAQRQEEACGMGRAVLKAREMGSQVQPMHVVR